MKKISTPQRFDNSGKLMGDKRKPREKKIVSPDYMISYGLRIGFYLPTDDGGVVINPKSYLPAKDFNIGFEKYLRDNKLI